MTDEEVEKALKEFVEMLNNLRLIKDKGCRKWLKAEIRAQLTRVMTL